MDLNDLKSRIDIITITIFVVISLIINGVIFFFGMLSASVDGIGVLGFPFPFIIFGGCDMGGHCPSPNYIFLFLDVILYFGLSLYLRKFVKIDPRKFAISLGIFLIVAAVIITSLAILIRDYNPYVCYNLAGSTWPCLFAPYNRPVNETLDCGWVLSPSGKQDCIIDQAMYKEDLDMCSLITDPLVKDRCLEAVIRSSKDSSYCNLITHEPYISWCKQYSHK